MLVVGEGFQGLVGTRRVRDTGTLLALVGLLGQMPVDGSLADKMKDGRWRVEGGECATKTSGNLRRLARSRARILASRHHERACVMTLTPSTAGSSWTLR